MIKIKANHELKIGNQERTKKRCRVKKRKEKKSRSIMQLKENPYDIYVRN